MDYIVQEDAKGVSVLFRLYQGLGCDELYRTADSWRESPPGKAYELHSNNDQMLTEIEAGKLANSWGVPLMFSNGQVPSPQQAKDGSQLARFMDDIGDYSIVDPETPPDTEPS